MATRAAATHSAQAAATRVRHDASAVAVDVSTKPDTPSGWDRVVRHAVVLLGGTAVSSLLALASLSISAKSLSQDAFGMLVIAQTYALLVERIGTFQSWQTLIRFGAMAREQGDDAALRGLIRFGRRLDLAGAMVGGTLGITIALFAGARFGWSESTQMLAIAYGGTVLLRMNGTSLAVLRLFERFDQTAIARAASGVIRLGGTVVAVVTDASLPVFAAVWMISDVVPSAVMAFFSVRALPARDPAEPSPLTARALRARFPEMTGMFWTTNWHSTIKVVARDGDVLVAGLVGGPAVAGAVRIARQVGGAMGQLADPLTQAIYPALSSAAASGQLAQVRALTLRAARWGAGIGAVVVLGLAVLAPTVLRVFAGDAYATNSGALLLFAAAQALSLATLAVSPALLALGHARLSFTALCIATVVYGGLLVPAIHQWGALGAAAALVAYQLVWGVIASRGVARATTPARLDVARGGSSAASSLIDQHAT